MLRYTTAESFLLARAPTQGRDHAFRARATARRIVEEGSFRGVDGTGLSAGDQWLHSCAYGDGPRGCASPEKWIQVGHNQHMNFAVSRLTTAG